VFWYIPVIIAERLEEQTGEVTKALLQRIPSRAIVVNIRSFDESFAIATDVRGCIFDNDPYDIVLGRQEAKKLLPSRRRLQRV
jgi:hypothetical protein